MQIANNHVVTLNYTLKDNDDNILDKSEDGSFCYLHGASNIIPGLENALSGKASGDTFSVTIPPKRPMASMMQPRHRMFPAACSRRSRKLKPACSSMPRVRTAKWSSSPLKALQMTRLLLMATTRWPASLSTLRSSSWRFVTLPQKNLSMVMYTGRADTSTTPENQPA